ncbi:rhodanese-like domain-containing protein 4A, chloroplastic [Vicia villosa]|uniref:rhodanese-like domain-containing protein 4A, chloroplastic n=1 Tax=Vicia villosa TaxID=3911 RepID=UPI00273B86CC|nr:rhodanese-like domain-containing protein 4A, chloroplastic [Vicia villosa]
MDSLSLLLSYPKLSTPKPPNSLFSASFPQPHISPPNKKPQIPFLKPHSPISLTKSCFSLATINLFTPLQSLAAEPPLLESDAGRINIESILISIDDFFNRYPFFVAACSFVYLVGIPLAEEYFRKYKFVSAIDAFRKLRDEPDSQLLDIRDRKNVKFLPSPNLMMLKKEVVQVEFKEGNEDGFVKKVLERFRDAENTVVFILDSFDGNSLKVAELLFKNGFKEAYAIKGGVRGQQGWMAIQDTLLPPPVHMNRRKKKTKVPQELGTNGNGSIQQNDSSNESVLSSDIPAVGNQETENGHVKRSVESNPKVKLGSVVSYSPYPNYPDLKPPSSPTPSKPQ